MVYLNVGGTESSTRRYEMKEFVRTSQFNIEDETQSFELYESKGVTNNTTLASIDLPSGASTFTIYRVDDIDSYIDDDDETHGMYLQVGGTNATSSSTTGTCSACGGSAIGSGVGFTPTCLILLIDYFIIILYQQVVVTQAVKIFI